MRSSSPFIAKAVTATTGIALSSAIVLEPLGDFEAGDFGQLDIHQDQVGTMLAREIERLDAVAGADGLVAVRLQQVVEELHVELVVLHDQDGLGHPPPFRAVPAPEPDTPWDRWLHAPAREQA